MDGKELVSGAAYDVYMDIKKRTNGEIYFGVVGPVRTGKSTFIKRFMELCVLPSMKDDNKRKGFNQEMKKKRRSREKTGGNSSSVKGYFSISKLNFSVLK